MCAIALSTPIRANAATFGNLSVGSALGEPLDAEIELRSIRPSDSIVARVASERQYRQARIEYNPALASTRIQLVRRADGQIYIKAMTSTPVHEPVVNLLVELDSGQQVALANYAILLDPPEYRQAALERRRAAATAAAPRPSVAAPRVDAPAVVADVASPAEMTPPPPDPIALRQESDAFPKAPAVAEAALQSPRFAIARYEVQGADRVSRQVLDKALSEFTGPGKDFETIQSAVATVQRVYTDAGYGTVRVVIPEQDIDAGVVRLQLIEGKIGAIEVTGNQHYSEANIRASLPALRRGEIPNSDEIAKALRLANESSSKNTQVTFRQTVEPMLVDAVVRVTDAPTRRFVASLDNTGTDQTGRWRAGIAYQDSNLFDRDHTLGLQALTSVEHPSQVAVLGVNYRVPFYKLGGAVEASAGYSNVNSGSINTPAGTYGIRGSGRFAGIHYMHLLPRIGAWDQRVNAGIDYRYFSNNVELTGSTAGSVIPDFETLPVSLTYSGFTRNTPTEWNASVSLVQNLPRGSHGTTTAFQAPGGRQGAVGDYRLVRYTFEGTHTLPADWKLRGVWTGQQTADALIPGEQFAVGGIDSVRGFGERVIANDRGDRGSVELYTPQIDTHVLGAQGRLLAFVDGAILRRNHALPSEITKATVSSAGLGFRLGVGAAQLRVDTAFVIDGVAPQYPRGGNHTHVRLLYLF